MFDRSITDTEKFTDMPMSTKALYFLLGMDADDEGFVSARKILKIHGGTEDDLKILLAKGFCIRFDSGILVITHWKKNNWLDSRRIRKTEYTDERKQLLTIEGNYVLSNGLASIEESRVVENRIVTSKREIQEPELNPEQQAKRLAEGRALIRKQTGL